MNDNSNWLLKKIILFLLGRVPLFPLNDNEPERFDLEVPKLLVPKGRK